MSESASKKILVKDIMTKKAIFVSPETPVVDAARIISEHNFDGLPVIDKNDILVGIVTEYDLITKTSSINASFLQKILSEVRNENPLITSGSGLSSMKVSEIMNPEPLTLREDATFEEVMKTFIAHHRVNPIPVVNESSKLVGIVSRFDILRPLNLLGYGTSKK